MRYDNFARLTHQIQSLSESTQLHVSSALTKVSADLDRRCSPYITHQSVVFDTTWSPWDGNITLRNLRFTLYIEAKEKENDNGHVQDGLICEAIEDRVPYVLFENLRKELSLVGYDLPESGLCRVKFFVPVLDCYDEEGKPVFLAAPELADTEAEIEDVCYLSDEVLKKLELL